ncbi:hypothetical protein T484DRAFT_1814410, partial [Baffinella frigidus]
EEKLKREAEERLASNMMKLDHLERARREKERPLLGELLKTQLEEDKELGWSACCLGELLKTQLEEDKVNIETQKRTFLENHKKAHATDVASK